MKIAFVNHPTRVYKPPPEGGSVDIWIHEVARRLAKSCSVVVYSPRGSLLESELCDGVEYRRVPDSGWIERAVQHIQRVKGGWRMTRRLQAGFCDFRSPLYYVGYGLGVAIDLRTQDCDVVNIMNLSQFAPIIHALNPQVRLVLHMRSLWLTAQEPRVIERRLRSVDTIISTSEFVARHTGEALPGLTQRCWTLYNGVDVERFGPNPVRRADGAGAPRILFATRVSPEKGLHVLMDAFALVVRRFPLATLQIAGPPEQFALDLLPTICGPAEVLQLASFYNGKSYLECLKERAADLQLEKSIAFLGLLPHEDLARHYQEADVFVFPSLAKETFGMPVAEAMASGLPVVASRVGGVPELVEHDKTGLLVEPNNPTVLANAILHLLENRNLRLSMGQAARERALALFSCDRVVDALVQHYECICGASKN